MQVQDLFEAHYADVHSVPVDEVKAARMGNDSYKFPSIAAASRMFHAGFEAKEGELLRVSSHQSMDSPLKCVCWDKAKAPSKPCKAKAGIDFVGESGGSPIAEPSTASKSASRKASRPEIRTPRESLVGTQRGVAKVISYSRPFYTLECVCGNRYQAGYSRISHKAFTGRCHACAKARASAFGKHYAQIQIAHSQAVCSHGHPWCILCAFPTLEIAMKRIGR